MVSFTGLNDQICKTAYFDIVEYVVEATSENGTLNKKAGCIVVLNPTMPYEPKYRNAIMDDNFDDLVLWQYDFGDRTEHEVDRYIQIARAKAFTSYLTGLTSHQVQQVMPALYARDMTKWGGSAVAGPGPMRLIVAFSGVQWYYDQMISEMMISAIKAVCHEQMVAVMESDEALIGPTAPAD